MFDIIKLSGTSKFTTTSAETREEALEIAKKNSKNSCIAVFEKKKEVFRFENEKLMM